jgi:CRISPR-associated protein Csb1
MSESIFPQFLELLKPDGPVAVVLKQSLAPVNEDDPIIFPPSYPIITFKGRVHTILDGDYRVSVELPANAKREKNEKDPDQTSGYNIDRFPDGTNCCEIDSPQSQANRIEPLFKQPAYRDLVPQIQIKVGNDPIYGTTVNLLDAGHRAADAVVRMSSLADRFHTAFSDVKSGNDFTLATLAPTSLLFGVWDSRSTQVKIQRILKASIRASNVRECTRSAQFTPAADYVAAGAVTSDLDEGKGDQNPLSSEGMQHALAVQKVGGVMLTSASELARTVNVNLVALRALRASDAPRTEALQRYILGLALLAATIDQDLNLREGCNLRFKDNADTPRLVPRRGEARPVSLEPPAIIAFARASAKSFFDTAGIPFDRKDHLEAIFETGVAEEFLAMGDDRDRVRRLGPITRATLKLFHDQKTNPFKSVADSLKTAKAQLPNKSKKGQPPVPNSEALRNVYDALNRMLADPLLPDNVRVFASELADDTKRHQDPHSEVKRIEMKLREFKKSQKDGTNTGLGNGETESGK